MKYLLFVGILIVSGNIVNAQTNFFKGYYVGQEGDTVKGLIEDRSDIGNFTACNFKSSADAQVETLTSEDILAFGFDGGVAYQEFIYTGKTGTLDGFFRLLVKGKLTLVGYDTRYFAVTDKREIYEVTRTSTEASGKMKESFLGLGHLKLLMSDCPTTNEAWLRKEYSDRNLKKVFITYNQCVKSNVTVFDEPKSSAKFNLGAQILPSVITMKSEFPMDQMNSNVTMAGGFFVSVRNPRKWLNIAVVLEGNYYQYSGYRFFKQLVQHTNNDVFVKYSAIQLPLFLRIGQKYFLDLGLQNNFLIKQEVRWRVETETSAIITSDGAVDKLPFSSIGFLLGGGMKFNVGTRPMRVFARYSRAGGDISHRMACIGVSFQLANN
jgi:hypothetical protein